MTKHIVLHLLRSVSFSLTISSSHTLQVKGSTQNRSRLLCYVCISVNSQSFVRRSLRARSLSPSTAATKKHFWTGKATTVQPERTMQSLCKMCSSINKYDCFSGFVKQSPYRSYRYSYEH